MAQRPGEGVADLRVDLDLRDAGELVLDRILHGDDLLDAVVYFFESAGQRGGLAGAGRARDQHDAAGGPQPAAEQIEVVRLHAELLQRQIGAFLGQEAQDDGFAEGAGHGGDADVHVLAGDAARNPPVLRQAALGDVDAADELDARRHRGKALARLGEAHVQHAVHAHSDDEAFLLGFQVDVRSAGVHGLREEVVDEFDDGRLLRHLAQQAEVVAGEQVLDGAFLAHVVQQAIQVVVRRDAEGDCLLRVEVAEGLLQGAVFHIPRQAAQAVAIAPQQGGVVEKPIELDGRFGHEAVHVHIRRQFAIAQIGRAQPLRLGLQHDVLGDGTVGHQERRQPAADGAADLLGLGEVRIGDGTALEQEFAQGLHRGIIPPVDNGLAALASAPSCGSRPRPEPPRTGG